MIVPIVLGLLGAGAFLLTRKPKQPRAWTLDVNPPAPVVKAGQALLAKYMGKIMPESEMTKVIGGRWWLFKPMPAGLATYRGDY